MSKHNSGFAPIYSFAPLLIAICLVASSCATMNEDECRSANWLNIGYEDGLRGYPSSRIADHRRACAKHAISPNLNQYEKGRLRGLQTYCQPRNGYRIGTQNGRYSGVCPPPLDKAFIQAMEEGNQIYQLQQTVRMESAKLKKAYEQLDLIEKMKADKENMLVQDGIGSTRRKQLLNEIRQLEDEQQVQLSVVTAKEEELNALRQNLSELQDHNPYP